MTGLPYTMAIGYNAVPGATHVSASKPGYTFIDQDVTLPAGRTMTVMNMRPLR